MIKGKEIQLSSILQCYVLKPSYLENCGGVGIQFIFPNGRKPLKIFDVIKYILAQDNINFYEICSVSETRSDSCVQRGDC